MKTAITKPYIGKEEVAAVGNVLTSGWLVQGKYVKEFEKRVADHEHVKYCCATTSCTTALQLTMMAEGMTEGMDVLVPSFTFVATANAVVSTGAIPVLMDVCPDTYNIDPKEVDNYIKQNYTKSTSGWGHKETGNRLWGIVPVHQFGLCADMKAINEIAAKYRIKVIEDAACALGSRIGDTHIGQFGNPACISFHPRKSITTGEGGMVLTNNDELYHRVLELRNHGSSVASDERHAQKGFLLPRYSINGFNYRMTDIQGAIGCEQMKKLDFILKRRREIADYYNQLLSQKNSILKLPYVPEGYYHSFQSYVCLLDLHNDIIPNSEKRNNIMECLEASGITTRQGTHAVHKLDYYKKRFGYRDNDLPVSNSCDSLSISLPVYVELTMEEQRAIAEHLLELTVQ